MRPKNRYYLGFWDFTPTKNKRAKLHYQLVKNQYPQVTSEVDELWLEINSKPPKKSITDTTESKYITSEDAISSK